MVFQHASPAARILCTENEPTPPKFAHYRKQSGKAGFWIWDGTHNQGIIQGPVVFTIKIPHCEIYPTPHNPKVKKDKSQERHIRRHTT